MLTQPPYWFLDIDLNSEPERLRKDLAAWETYIETHRSSMAHDPRLASLIRQTMLRCGVTHAHLEQYEQALVHFRHVLACGPDTDQRVLALSMLGAIFCEQGQDQEAITVWSQALEQIDHTPPRTRDTYGGIASALCLCRGLMYGRIQQHQQAIDDCTLVLVWPSRTSSTQAHVIQAECYSVRGLSYAYLGQWEQAEQDCRHALTIHPATAMRYHRLGKVLLLKKDYQHALPPLSKARELDPDNEAIRCDLLDALIHCLDDLFFSR